MAATGAIEIAIIIIIIIIIHALNNLIDYLIHDVML